MFKQGELVTVKSAHEQFDSLNGKLFIIDEYQLFYTLRHLETDKQVFVKENGKTFQALLADSELQSVTMSELAKQRVTNKL